MSMKETLRRWRRGNAAGGTVGRRLARALRRSRGQLSSDPTIATAAEHLVGTAVVTSTIQHDTDCEPALRAAQDRLMAAAGATAIAVADAERDRDDLVRRGRLRRGLEKDRREETTLGAPVDHAAPLVPGRVVTGAELVLSVVETGFWYLVFSDDIDRRVSLLSSQRLSAIGLAVFIPVLGILAARLAGPAWQRYLRYPVTEPHQRRTQKAAALAGLVMVSAAGIGAWFLVSWRYSASNPSNTFSVLPPAWCMALLFVGSVVMLALLRTFSDSEQHEVNTARDAAVAADQAERKQVHDRVVDASIGWAVAWTALRQLVNVGLNEAERLVTTGEHILLENRSLSADSPFPKVRSTSASTQVPAAAVASIPGEARLQYHVDVNLITTRLRVHEAALATLVEYAPPVIRPDADLLRSVPTSVPADVASLNERIAKLLGELRVPGTGEQVPADDGRQDAEPEHTESGIGEPAAPRPNVVREDVPDAFRIRLNGHDRAGTAS